MHSVDAIAAWLENTPLALWVGQGEIAYPFLLCVHVVGLATFAGLLTVVDLRLLGSFPAMPYVGLRAPLRLAWFGLAINAASGAALFASQATLFVHNTPFLIKLSMIAIAALAAGLLQVAMRRDASAWDSDGGVPGAARAACILSLTAVAAAIVAGRLIAYF